MNLRTAHVFRLIVAFAFLLLSLPVFGATAQGVEGAFGQVDLMSLECQGVTDPFFHHADEGLGPEEPCTPVETTFTFYLVGDGTADYEQVSTSAGAASITLAVGDYEVHDEVTGATTTVTVIAGGIVHLNSFSHSDTPPTGDDPIGTLGIITLDCPFNDEAVIFVEDPVTGESIPNYPVDRCSQVNAVYQITGPNGTGTFDTAVDGTLFSGVAGAYQVTDTTSGVTVTVNIAQGQRSNIMSVHASSHVQGSLTLETLQCSNAANNFMQSSQSENNVDISTLDCVNSYSTFRIVGGTTDMTMVTDLNQSIWLDPGTYTVTDLVTGTSTTVTVGGIGETFVLSVQTNQDDVTPTATATATSTATQAPAQPAKTPAAATSTAPVTGLPNTGAQPESTLNLTLPLAALTLGGLALIGFELRVSRKR